MSKKTILVITSLSALRCPWIKNVEEKNEFKKKIVILAYVTPWHPWVKRVSQLGLANIYTYIYINIIVNVKVPKIKCCQNHQCF